MAVLWRPWLKYRFDLLVVAICAPVMRGVNGILVWLHPKYYASSRQLEKLVAFCVIKVAFKLYQFFFHRVFFARERIMAYREK
ncbi:Uncharacterised protein [Edwardsiella hoshinae]|uniref:Uncharacterized protein n=1 Tax=Edwardsiella hoshinae TaxID=93378 RepID=A0A376DHF8_9GAMM|nr:hypothetical protein [Edwardsiella hoshinae]STC89462.1 Uncharacterised protein [Edwardsiella hoshinae]